MSKSRFVMLWTTLLLPMTGFSFCPDAQRTTRHLMVLKLEDDSVDGFVSDFDREIGEESQWEGEALAQEFYKQVQIREAMNDPTGMETTALPLNPQREEEELRFRNASPFSKRREMSSSKKDVPGRKKFTGARTSSNSAGLFSSSAPKQTLYSVPNNANIGRQTPREQMFQDEISLLNMAEKTIISQGIIALGLATLFVVVGLSGGISNGADRFVDDMALDFPMGEIMSIEAPEIKESTSTGIWL